MALEGDLLARRKWNCFGVSFKVQDVFYNRLESQVMTFGKVLVSRGTRQQSTDAATWDGVLFSRGCPFQCVHSMTGTGGRRVCRAEGGGV